MEAGRELEPNVPVINGYHRLRTWVDDIDAAAARGRLETARAHALAAFPSSRALRMKAAALEKESGTAESLDEVLAMAMERVPRAKVLWLMRVKEK